MRRLAEYNFIKWQVAFNKSFNKPTERQKELINEVIEKYGKFVNGKDIEFIKHCIAP